jgi:hypothetical protein
VQWVFGPAPSAPTSHHAPPVPLSISFSFPAQQLLLPLFHLSSTFFASLYLIFFSRAATSSPSLPPLFHLLCPRCDPVDGCRRSSDPKVSFPSPSSLPPFPLPCPRAPWRGPDLAPGARNAFTYARSPVPTRTALACATFKFRLTSFKFSLIYVLRRVLRRATIYFKFRFIRVLRRTIRRVTINFNFRLFNVLCRVFSRATFSFNSVQVAYAVVRFVMRRFTLISYLIQVFRCALRRATIRLISV